MKQIKFDTKKLIDGVNLVADAVKVTLGAKGRNVVIKRPFQTPHVTKDGITVAREIESNDAIEQVGVEMIKEAIEKIGEEVGDGTTTVAVLTQEITRQGKEFLKDKSKGILSFKENMYEALEDIKKLLKERSEKVTLKSSKLKEIALISANGDEEIADLIVTSLRKAGKNGNVKVIPANSTKSFISETKGIEIEKGYLSPYFVTDTKTMKVKYEDVLILYYDGKLDNVHIFSNIVNKVMNGAKKPFIVIADDYSEEILNLMVMNRMKTQLPIAAIKAPSLGDNRKELMQDMAVLTGGSYISSSMGLSLETMSLNDLGQADSIEISKSKTLIIGGRGEEKEIEIRIEEVKNSDINSNFKKERLSNLEGNTILINVGAYTETELREKLDRIDDALHAAKASLEEGFVPGGGLTLATIGKELYIPDNENRGGYDIVVDSLFTPMLQIMLNAGLTEESILETVGHYVTKDIGYDVKSMAYVNMKEKGIIDPTKVVRMVVETAISVAAMILSTEVVIAAEKEKEMNDINPYNFM